VSTCRRYTVLLIEILVLSLSFPAQRAKAAQRTGAQVQAGGGQSAITRLIVNVRDEGGASFDGLASVTLQHLDSPVLSTGTTMGGQAIFDGLGPGEYTVTVTAPGYCTATERLNFTHASESEQAYISLKRDSGSATFAAAKGPPALSPKLRKELGKAVEALEGNRLGDAQKHLDAAYRLAPGNPEVNYIRGLLADRQGNLGSAQSSWEKTVSLDPKHALGLQALATILAR